VVTDALPPDTLRVEPLALSAEQQAWVDKAWALVDEARLREIVAGMVAVPSPTGEERALAEHLAAVLDDAGLRGAYQPIDDDQGNAIGRLDGGRDGPDLLLYAPIDTLTAGDPDEDVPWVGPELRPDMRPVVSTLGSWVVGLGASNPKGHGACIVAAAEAVARAGVPLRGSLTVGLGAGGMPTNRRGVGRATRFNAGQGNGCSFLLEQGVYPDFAIIAKPGWTVDWEEVGLCWFRIRVAGRYSYVGSRHRIAFKNPIVDAATVIQGLEAWFPEYAHRNTSGLVAPQANIGHIEGGWARTASLSPAECRLDIDVRVSPRTTPADVKRQVTEALDRIVAANPGLDLSWDMTLSIPGTSTDPTSFVVQSCARGWEAVTGRPYEGGRNTSGATDANILRGRGVPTARIGMPKVRDPGGDEVDFSMGMNAVDPAAMADLTRALVYAIVDTCTRPRAAVGLGG
jgi:acetylornithine deacetylase/succinyl-diaminopimelate desuccinylase-like protein